MLADYPGFNFYLKTERERYHPILRTAGCPITNQWLDVIAFDTPSFVPLSNMRRVL